MFCVSPFLTLVKKEAKWADPVITIGEAKNFHNILESDCFEDREGH
jgi:hypothetical protein